MFIYRSGCVGRSAPFMFAYGLRHTFTGLGFLSLVVLAITQLYSISLSEFVFFLYITLSHDGHGN